MTVHELAQEVDRQKRPKKDFIATPWEGFQMLPDAKHLALQQLGEMPLGQYGHGDLAEFTAIPDREEQPGSRKSGPTHHSSSELWRVAA
jgi:hypothetical protein